MLEAREGEKRVRADASLKHNGVVYKCLDPECQHPEVILVAGARGLRRRGEQAAKKVGWVYSLTLHDEWIRKWKPEEAQSAPASPSGAEAL